MEYVLRPYQQKAVDDALACFKTKKNGILVLPTGSGKSLIVASIVTTLGGRTIILQPTKEILEQNKGKLEAAGYYDIGVYSASAGRKTVGAVTLATIGSVVRKQHLFDSFDRIIVDECHKVNSKGGMYEKFINGLKLPVIGLTATPYRMRNYNRLNFDDHVAESRILTRTRPRIFSKIAHITQVSELFESRYLCPLDYDWQNDYDSKQVKSTTTGQGFDDSSLKKYNEKQDITSKMVDLVAGTDHKHCLAFTKFTSESDKVEAALNDRGITVAQVSAKTKKLVRERILRDFKFGRIKCVVNVGVLTTGFDFPKLDCIVLGRPTKSVSLYYQMVGRGVRIAEGKPSCALHDLCDNVKRFGKIETFELYDQNGNDMWRLRSDAGNLTGVNVDTGENLENNRTVATNREKAKPGEVMITFGKHDGRSVADVPEKYLEWAVESFRPGRWKTLFKNELAIRKQGVS